MTNDLKYTLCDYKDMLESELHKELSNGMKACAGDYHRHKMIASIIETIKNIDDIKETYVKSKDSSYVYEDLSPETEMTWVASMHNTDGTTGAHWALDQTTSVARQYGIIFEHISPEDFYVALNMIYSRYGQTLKKAGISDVSVFVELAKDFLFDIDAVSPKKKLHCYYKKIVKK